MSEQRSGTVDGATGKPVDPAPPADETDFKEYVLKKGNTHSAIINGERKQLVGGDRLKLSESQFQSFSDKFRSFDGDEDADSERDAVVPGPAREIQTATGEPLTKEEVEDGAVPNSNAPPPAPANADPNASNTQRIDPVHQGTPGQAAAGTSPDNRPPAAQSAPPAQTAPSGVGPGAPAQSSSGGSSSGSSSGGSSS